MTSHGVETFRIACPNGHVHVAREAWLGREMICPECNAPFTIRRSDSLEYQAEQRRRQQADDEKRARAWIVRAVVAGVVVLLVFVAMVVASLNPQWFRTGPA